MLRGFRLANHRSFADEHELLLIPSAETAPAAPEHAIGVTAIYGANASGKSNLIGGLRFLCDAVTGSADRWDTAGGVPRRPFRLRAGHRIAPSTFGVELMLDGVLHLYGCTLDDERVLEEWLYSYPSKRRRTVFTRAGDEITLGSTVTRSKANLAVVRELLRPNALLLSLAPELALAELTAVHRWFATGALFCSGRNPFPNYAQITSCIVDTDEHSRRRFVDLLAAADVGIEGVCVHEERHPRDAEVPAQRWVRSISNRLSTFRPDGTQVVVRFAHHDSTEPFDILDESAGTQAWIELLPAIISALEHGQVLVVDEIDASLHSLLTARLIALFRDRQTNPNGAQLIFSTHDATLLGTALGERLLDTDAVWFVRKDDDGASAVYPLTDLPADLPDERGLRYLGGAYGAIPRLDAADFADALRGR